MMLNRGAWLKSFTSALVISMLYVFLRCVESQSNTRGTTESQTSTSQSPRPQINRCLHFLPSTLLAWSCLMYSMALPSQDEFVSIVCFKMPKWCARNHIRPQPHLKKPLKNIHHSCQFLASSRPRSRNVAQIDQRPPVWQLSPLSARWFQASAGQRVYYLRW